MRDACVPYFEILDKWISEGIIYDPYNEFFIEDTSLQKEAAVPDRSDEYVQDMSFETGFTIDFILP